ncbi:MAG: hypothetical protein J3R72DRAFT_505796 [Linnemannia gamsii]|nr:MAG: hypothetical protein J3R72DRAFT_505796 [Linnemannia gamsii]
MNRAAYSDTRSSPAYHPPLPLNTSNYRSKIPNNNHEIIPCAGTTFPSSIASPLTPSSTTSTTGRGAPWVRSRAATTHTSTVASYKDDFSCHTPISPLPSFPPPTSTPSLANNSKSDSKNPQTANKGHRVSSTRLRTQTSGAIISHLPTSTPLSPLAFTFDDIWTTKTKTTTGVIPIIDTSSAGLGKGNFHNGHQQPHHGQSVKTPTGTASHRYASILPPPRHMTQSTAVSQQQLPSPLPSPLVQNSSNNTSYVPPLQAPIPQYQRGRHIQPTTTVSSFLSFSRLSHPLQQQQQQQLQQGFASFLEECLEESEENEPRPSENDDDGDEDHRNESTTSACDGGIIRARTTSLHYNLFPHPTTDETTTKLSDFPLPPTTTMTGAAAAAWGTSMEGKVMPWLQEAMQTVTMLESRLHELEEDCKAIPLYEQDRLEMIQVIQDLDAMVLQDQGWIEHAETAIQWTSYVLENALISSSSSNGQRTTTTTRTRERMFSGEKRNSNADVGFVVPGLERNTRSEGMLPALLVRDSERTLELLSSPLETGTGTGLGLGEGSVSVSGECLLESNVDPSQLDMSSTSTVDVPRSSSAVGDEKNFSDSQKQMGEKRGLGLDLSQVVENSSSTSRPAESQEAMYRSAIMAALRHLKTIDLAPSLASPSSSSKDGCKTTSSRESGSSVVNGQDTKEKGRRRRERTSIRTGGTPPDRALKDWLDNSSMMSIFSNVIGEDKDYEDAEEESGSDILSVSRVLAAVEETSTSNHNKDHGQTARTPEMISSSPSTQMRRRRHLLVGSLSPLDEVASPSPTTYTQGNMISSSLAPSANSSTQTLSHALSTASINATISGSSQSLQTNLGHTLMDERVYLKQHIQQLDRLRIQELTRHQRIEQGHRQLIADLGRFSKELLGSVNELTCAQAALDEASELALLTLSTLEKGTEVGGGTVVDLTMPQKQQEPATNERGSIAHVASTTTTTTTNTNNNHVTARHKRLIAASRKELETSGGLAGECIKRIRRLAADCVGITEFAAQGQQQQPTFSPAANVVASSSGGVSAGESSGGGSGLQRYALATEVVSPLDLKAIPTTAGTFVNTTKELGATATTTGMTSVQGLFQTGGSVHAKDSTLPPPPPSSLSMFVDGIAFQEFEDHLASVRSSSSSIMNGASAISESMIIKRVFLSASSSSSSARLNTTQNNNNNNKMVNKRNNNAQSSGPSAFMKKVLVEDIYPCLMPQNNGHIGATTSSALSTKQSHGWMSAFLSFSSSTPATTPSSHGINNNSAQGQWLQQLLKAMEANACEIEAWKPAPASISTTATPSTTTMTTAAAAVGSKGSLVIGRTSPLKVTCCLCGTIRPCEFRLRLLDHPSSSSTSAPSSSSPPTVTSPPHQQQQQQQQHHHHHHHHALDRFCRDRIVAVCDFFMFLAHLRQGLLDQPSSLELFRRALGLRQRMALARIGSMDLVLQGRSVDASVVTRE